MLSTKYIFSTVYVFFCRHARLISTNNIQNVKINVIMESNVEETVCPTTNPDSSQKIKKRGSETEANVQIKAEESVQTQRLASVSGWEARVNDIIYCPPEKFRSSKAKSRETTVVYFGGDVQDYTENMEKQRDGKRYIDWNLENTAVLLHRKFPSSHLVIVKPSRMEYLTFSCFKNFVSSNDFGIPAHCPNYFAMQHLEKLLQNVKNRLGGIDEVKEVNYAIISKPGTMETDEDDLVLIGFSKGCVVLNQLVGEFHFRDCEVESARTDASDGQLFSARIREMYWLDGGHSGGRNTWITNKPLLKTLAELQASLHVHVTPYQVEDERRPWIGKEERIFTDTLLRYGATLQRMLHFAGSSNVDITTHFNVLNAFKPDLSANTTLK